MSRLRGLDTQVGLEGLCPALVLDAVRSRPLIIARRQRWPVVSRRHDRARGCSRSPPLHASSWGGQRLRGPLRKEIPGMRFPSDSTATVVEPMSRGPADVRTDIFGTPSSGHPRGHRRGDLRALSAPLTLFVASRHRLGDSAARPSPLHEAAGRHRRTCLRERVFTRTRQRIIQYPRGDGRKVRLVSQTGPLDMSRCAVPCRTLRERDGSARMILLHRRHPRSLSAFGRNRRWRDSVRCSLHPGERAARTQDNWRES